MNKLEQQEITIQFYNYQVWYFKMLGLWIIPADASKQQRFWHQLRFSLFFGIVSIMLIFFSIRVIGNIADLRVIIQVFFMFATEISCMIKLLSIKLKDKEHAHLMDRMHSSDFQPKHRREAMIFRDAANLAVKFRNYYGIICMIAAILLLIAQFFVDNSALPLAMYEPCDLATSNCYYGLYLYHVLSLLVTCWLNIAFDSLVPSLLIFLRAQLVNLMLRLECLGAVETAKDNECIALRLRECCIHYNRIVELRDLMDGFIKVPCSLQLFCSVLVLICNFYDMSTNTGETAFMIKTATYQLAMLLQIFIVCYAANEVTDQSIKLCYALYKSEWTTWNKANRKMCVLMMIRFNSGLCVRTLNHTQSFSLTTFSSIVNCSYSYFALLKRVNS